MNFIIDIPMKKLACFASKLIIAAVAAILLWVQVSKCSGDDVFSADKQSNECFACPQQAEATTKPFAMNIFDTEDFPPRWYCGTWDSFHGWLHITSDLITWLAYSAIPISILVFVRKKKTLPFLWLFILFGLFIILCGITHLLEAVMFWWPVYRLMGIVKAITACVSIATAVALLPVLPKAFALRTPAELEAEIRQREMAAEKLLESESRFKRAITGSSAGLWEWSPSSNQVWFAPRFKLMLGFSEASFENHFENWIELIHTDHRQQLLETLENLSKSGDTFSLDIPIRTRQDGYRWFQVRGQIFPSPNGGHEQIVSGSLQDINERVIAQEQVRAHEEVIQHEQKLVAIGTLAGGVAHEFNNMLQIIMSYIDFAIESNDENSDSCKDLTIARRTAEKAGKITQQLLNYSRESSLDMANIDLNDVVKEVAELLSSSFGCDYEIFTFCSEEKASIRGDYTKLAQAIMNLCLNARDSMKDGGQITIQTTVLDTTIHTNHETNTFPKKLVKVAITDEGCGILRENWSRVFDPFFTTKEVGSGTGLGLSVTQGIVLQHHGTIAISRSDEHGTEFQFELPFNDSSDTQIISSNENLRAAHGELILLAEDDDLVRESIMRSLIQAGYKVVCATTGAKAVELYNSLTPKPDLLVMDVLMPRMNGIEAYNRIRKKNRDARVIFLTGYSPSASNVQLSDSHCETLSKPVDKTALLSKIRGLIGKVQIAYT